MTPPFSATLSATRVPLMNVLPPFLGVGSCAAATSEHGIGKDVDGTGVRDRIGGDNRLTGAAVIAAVAVGGDDGTGIADPVVPVTVSRSEWVIPVLPTSTPASLNESPASRSPGRRRW